MKEHPRPQRIVFVGPAPFAPMAAGCFQALALPTRATAMFATRGAKPRTSAAMAKLMREVGGIDWRPLLRELDRNLIEAADLVVTIGRAGRPRVSRLPGVPWRREHWALAPRTSEVSGLVRARQLSDNLRARIAMLIFMEGWGRPETSRETERRARPIAVEGHHPFIPMRPFRIAPLVATPH